MKPLVSIITPSFNQGNFIRETIESVLSQDYDNIEYIVVDGGSTDDTLSILAEYEGRLKFISEKDNGQSDAINKGLKMAHGEIVAWLNSDDVYEKGCVSKAVEIFENNQNTVLVYSDGYIIDKDSNKLKIFEATQEFDYWKLVNFWDYIMQPTTFFSAEALKKIGFLDESLNYCMDWDLWIRLASVGKVIYVRDFFACSREYEETKTSTGGDVRLKEIKRLLYKYSRDAKPLGIMSYTASTIYSKYGTSEWKRSMLGRWLAYVHKKLTAKMPVKYDDGWIGKEYRQIIPDYLDRIELSIRCPDERLMPQRVKVRLNGKQIDDLRITDTDSREIVIINGDQNYSEYSLVCSKTKRLSKGDTRELGLMIETE